MSSTNLTLAHARLIQARPDARPRYIRSVLLVGAVLLAVYVLDAPWSVIVVGIAAVVEVGETFFWIWLSRRRRIQMGPETLVGSRARVVVDCLPQGQVRAQGELWQALCPAGARAGEWVRVTALDGLTLVVEPE
jgi:membrane-bound serine protease (ClpP class)